MERWATISATATNPMLQAEADRINVRNMGWAYKIDDTKANQIIATRETLLRPADAPGGAAPPAGLPAGLPPGLLQQRR
jgi:hypothetical protein